jgi:hypothetical protein
MMLFNPCGGAKGAPPCDPRIEALFRGKQRLVWVAIQVGWVLLCARSVQQQRLCIYRIGS